MSLPFFYKEDIDPSAGKTVLSEEGSKHIIQVLRMTTGEQLNLTDGKGNLYTSEIISDNRKRCEVRILSILNSPLSNPQITIAISPIKNSSRFEWFLEKATEIGVSAIIPLICERTEKQHFKRDRMKGILVSAMLQSQQTWLPVLHEPVRFADLPMSQFDGSKKFIAHCEDEQNKLPLSTFQPFNHSTILIGPEGDFSKKEIELALQHKFQQVALGETRLRTETAGVYAAVLLKSI